ncbi:hypothetical protein C0J52_19594 [Blattella germanica]|nr:hypothetical protein C0J52_19594 [Blattella germanica]
MSLESTEQEDRNSNGGGLWRKKMKLTKERRLPAAQKLKYSRLLTGSGRSLAATISAWRKSLVFLMMAAFTHWQFLGSDKLHQDVRAGVCTDDVHRLTVVQLHRTITVVGKKGEVAITSQVPKYGHIRSVRTKEGLTWSPPVRSPRTSKVDDLFTRSPRRMIQQRLKQNKLHGKCDSNRSLSNLKENKPNGKDRRMMSVCTVLYSTICVMWYDVSDDDGYEIWIRMVLKEHGPTKYLMEVILRIGMLLMTLQITDGMNKITWSDYSKLLKSFQTWEHPILLASPPSSTGVDTEYGITKPRVALYV